MSDSITDEVVTAYLETLICTSTVSLDAEHSPLPEVKGWPVHDGMSLGRIVDVSDVKENWPGLIDDAREDLVHFRTLCLNDIGIDPFRLFNAKRVAHDFLLSRNGHGAGFFDDDYRIQADGPGQAVGRKVFEVKDELHRIAQNCSEHHLLTWFDEKNDNKLHLESCS